MKFEINDKSINIEYIANGKRNQLKLNNDDTVDMDFFNQLLKAKSNKRDAMCDLFKRKILKEDDGDVVHIQPLKLDKELKPSKYAEKIELTRRKQELEQDKQHIAEEAKTLIKAESQNKDVRNLSEDDLNDRNDLDKLKKIQERYLEISKVQQMVVSQIDSLDIHTADNVNIRELKNLTVNAFDNINKQLLEAKISDKDKQDIADSVANLIKPNYGQIKHLIDNLKNQLKQLRKEKIRSSDEINDSLMNLNSSVFTLSQVVDGMKNQLPESKVFNDFQGQLSLINKNITDYIAKNKTNYGTIKHSIDNLKNQIKQLRKDKDKSTNLIGSILMILNNSIVTLISEIIPKIKNLPTSDVVTQLKNQLESLNANIQSLNDNYAKIVNQNEQEDKISVEDKFNELFGENLKSIEDKIDAINSTINKLTQKDDKVDEDDEVNEDDEEKFKDILNDADTRIKTLEQKIAQLPDVFNLETLEIREHTLKRLAVDFEFLKRLRRSIIDGNPLISYIKEHLPVYTGNLDYTKLLRFWFGETTAMSVNWDKFHIYTIISQYKHLAFLWEDIDGELRLCTILEDTIAPIYNQRPGAIQIYKILSKKGDFDGDSINLYTVRLSSMYNIPLSGLVNHLYLSPSGLIPRVFDDPPLYLNIYATNNGTKFMTGDKGKARYPQLVLLPGDKDFASFFTRGDEISNTDNSSDGLSGKINIDLNQSSTNEKLNEIIRLLSQLNYNVFTTTPMFKSNKIQKKEKQSKGIYSSDSDDEEKVDLYKIFDL